MSRPLRFLCAFLIVSLACGVAQQPGAGSASGEKLLRAKNLQADAAILRQAYENLHPGLYRYNSKEQMDAAFDALAALLNHDQSLQDAYVAFSVFAAKVKCGHTYANFYNQPKSVVGQLFQAQNKVPFYFEWLNGRMVVTEDFTPGHVLPRGTQVLAIGATSTATILSRLMTVARADGANDAKRVAELGVRGDGLYEAFDVFFPMFFPQPGTKLKLRVQLPGSSKARDIEVEALTYEQRIAPIKSREAARKGGNEIAFEWKMLPDGSAYLKMPTWAFYDSKWDWKTWLNARMDEAADSKAPKLIVDLRGNEGGQDVGNVILSRLISQDLKLSSAARLVRYRKAPDDLVPHLDTWDPSFKNWGDSAKPLQAPWPTAPPVEYYRLTKYDDDADGEVIKSEGKRYAGKVFVLVDANNSSATFQFAQIVQQNKLGLLVGEPTGGNQRGINGGAFFFLRLPNSKIELDLPLIGYFPREPKPDAGLIPDIVVKTTASDIASGKDAVMETVLKYKE